MNPGTSSNQASRLPIAGRLRSGGLETGCGLVQTGASGGFTLLELVLVMVVIAIVIGVALPRLPDVAGMQIDRTSRKTGIMFQLVRNKAVTLRRYYRLDVDVDRSRLAASYLGPEELYIEDDAIRPVQFTDSVTIVDLITVQDGKVTNGRGEVHISPRGIVEPSVIHLADTKGRIRSIRPHMVSGQVSVENVYEELAVQ